MLYHVGGFRFGLFFWSFVLFSLSLLLLNLPWVPLSTLFLRKPLLWNHFSVPSSIRNDVVFLVPLGKIILTKKVKIMYVKFCLRNQESPKKMCEINFFNCGFGWQNTSWRLTRRHLIFKKVKPSFRSAHCDAYCNAHFVLLLPVTRFKFWGKIILQRKCISSARTKKPSSFTFRTR